jgi:hypothetical protein
MAGDKKNTVDDIVASSATRRRRERVPVGCAVQFRGVSHCGAEIGFANCFNSAQAVPLSAAASAGQSGRELIELPLDFLARLLLWQRGEKSP